MVVGNFALFFVNAAFFFFEYALSVEVVSLPFNRFFLSDLRDLLGEFLCARCHVQQSLGLSFACCREKPATGGTECSAAPSFRTKKRWENFSSLSNPWLFYLDSGEGGGEGENVCYQGLDLILSYWGEISNEVRKKSFVQAAAEQREAGAWVGWLGLEMDFAF